MTDDQLDQIKDLLKSMLIVQTTILLHLKASQPSVEFSEEMKAEINRLMSELKDL